MAYSREPKESDPLRVWTSSRNFLPIDSRKCASHGDEVRFAFAIIGSLEAATHHRQSAKLLGSVQGCCNDLLKRGVRSWARRTLFQLKFNAAGPFRPCPPF